MYEKEMTWKEAQSFCRKHHTDLATIRNKEENFALSSFEGWIGLCKENKGDDWKWSRGDKIATFFNWYDGEPDYNDQNCVSKCLSEGQWRDWECDKRFKVICQDEFLVLVKENKTWEEALEHCRALDGSSFQLVTLLTVDEHNYAQELAQTATTDEIWTGLRYLGDEWFWVGGELVLNQDLPKCPASQCAVLKRTQTSFRIKVCSERRNFFCYKKS